MNMKTYEKSYSKTINNFQVVNIKLLRSLDDICKDYDGIGIEPHHIEDSNIEKGEVCQITKTPSCYHVGFFNSRGNGRSYYTVINDRKFIENVDFIFSSETQN